MFVVYSYQLKKGEERSMKKALSLIIATVLAVCLVIGGFQTGWAQDDAFTLEEIVVTAQKREQQVQDVPIAMTVTNAEMMDRQKVYTLQDLSRTTPGLEFGDTGAAPGGAASIRGLGTSAFDAQQEPSVGVVVDGVAQGTSNAGNLFDVSRVEVLRGPQGTLFGFAASAGVINIITNAPELSVFKAKVGIDVTADDTLGNNFGRQEIRAMMNVPTSERTALRLTGYGNFTQGLWKNKAPEMDDSDAKNYGFRAKYLFEVSDDLSINLIGEYKKNETEGPNLFTLAEISPDDVLYPYFTGLGIMASYENQDNYSTHPQYGESEKYSASAEIDWIMANHDFVSITSFMRDKSGPNSGHIFGYDWTRPLLSIKNWGGESHMDMFTQELRISSLGDGRFNYLAGVYYNKIEREPDELGYFQLIPPLPPPPDGPPDFLIPILFPPELGTTRSTTDNQNYAVFADANYAVTDSFKVLGGLRYTVYDYSLRNEDTATGAVVEESLDKGFFTFRVGGQYDVNPDTMVYATVSSSVKSPVVDPPALDDPDGESRLIKAELPTSYELGTKLTAFGNRVALDVNGFYTKVKDYQGELCEINPENQALNCSQTNIDEVVSKGFEIDIFGQPFAGFRINTGYIYNIVTYPSEFSSVGLDGKQLMNTLRHKFTFSAEYERNLTSRILGSVAFDTVYKSDKRMNTELRPYAVYPAHWVTGARIGIRDINDRWNLFLFGRNLFEEPEPVGLYSFGESVIWQINTERSFRQVGLSFNMNF